MKLSIVIPTLNEARHIGATLEALQPLRRRGHEIIVADGWSNDDTVALARPLVDTVIQTKAGRAHQMNAGAARARGDIVLFLHADTRLPDDVDRHIADQLTLSRKQWGRFDVRLSGRHPLLRIVEFMMNWRSRLSGIATGDQAIFVTRARFEDVGGFPPIPLMEDIALSRQLKTGGAPLCLRQTVTTSSRRWEDNGIFRTIVLMWCLRLAFFLGADPAKLATAYYGRRQRWAFPRGRILVFAKAPIANTVKTRLIPTLSPDQAAELQRQLISHTLKTVTASGLAPVELWGAPDHYHPFFQHLEERFKLQLQSQTGADLGERMGNALETSLANDEYTLLIGTDCPSYDSDYLYAAFKALAQGADAVLGPAEDGGYVLIGLRRYDATLFRGIHWGSDSVLEETRRRLVAAGFCYRELPLRWDVDRPDDLIRLEQEPHWDGEAAASAHTR